MNIKILGTRGEIEESSPYHAKQSGILIDNKLLFDCGDKRFLAYNPEHIFITHLHPDHAFFVRPRQKAPQHIHLYAPEKHRAIPFTVIKKQITIGGYRIIPIPTIHSLKVKSVAYLVEHRNKKILYTGDMIWIEKKYHRLLNNLDLVIADASYIRYGGLVRRDKKTGGIYGHTGVPNLIALFKKYTSTILFVHFGAWFYKDMKQARRQLYELGREHHVTVMVGYDGLTLNI